MKKKSIIAGSISAVVIVAIIIVVVVFGSGLTSGNDNTIASIDTDQTSLEDVIDASVTAYCAEDYSTIEALLYEPFFTYLADAEGVSYDDYIDEAFFYWNMYGDDYDLSDYEYEVTEDADYEIEGTYYLSDDDPDTVESYQEAADDYGFDVTISEVAMVYVTVSFSDEDRSFYFYIMEIDGSWYLNTVVQE